MRKSQLFHRGQRTQVELHDAQNRLWLQLAHIYNVKCVKISCKLGKFIENKKIMYEAAKIAAIKNQKTLQVVGGSLTTRKIPTMINANTSACFAVIDGDGDEVGHTGLSSTHINDAACTIRRRWIWANISFQVNLCRLRHHTKLCMNVLCAQLTIIIY